MLQTLAMNLVLQHAASLMYQLLFGLYIVLEMCNSSLLLVAVSAVDCLSAFISPTNILSDYCRLGWATAL